MNKKSMPHINVEDKGAADLYFEFLEPKDRKEFFKDLTSPSQPTIKLPDFGKIDKNGPEISNDIKEMNEKDITKKTEDFIKFFTTDPKIPIHPYLDYNNKKHNYELKSKYDIEKMIQEFVKNPSKN